MVSRAYREKRACNAILSVKTSKSLLLLRIALSVINYCYGIRRVNGIRRHRLTILVMADHRWADQAEEEHCTIPSGARGARPRQPKRTEKDRDFAYVRYCSSLVGGQMLCSRSAAGRHSAIDRQQFRFTCVSANAISDTRHGWQPVSTASCRGRNELRMARCMYDASTFNELRVMSHPRGRKI